MCFGWFIVLVGLCERIVKCFLAIEQQCTRSLALPDHSNHYTRLMICALFNSRKGWVVMEMAANYIVSN